MKIRTENICPPIPDRRHDWTAWVDGKEEDGPYGYGPTEQDAINDLKEHLELIE